jgi:hypothetical protein
MKEIKERQSVLLSSPSLEFVKALILEAGNNIGSVHFIKRTDGKLRKMTYRLHVKNPSVASIPGSGKKDKKKKKVLDRKVINRANDQLTVLDTNKVVRDSSGEIIGRGSWRTIPLEGVVRVAHKGIIYLIDRDRD